MWSGCDHFLLRYRRRIQEGSGFFRCKSYMGVPEQTTNGGGDRTIRPIVMSLIRLSAVGVAGAAATRSGTPDRSASFAGDLGAERVAPTQAPSGRVGQERGRGDVKPALDPARNAPRRGAATRWCVSEQASTLSGKHFLAF